jgi:hypothetical protein
MALSDVQQQIDAREAEIKRLKEAFRFHGETVERDGYRYEKNQETGLPFGMPFCSVCIVNDGTHFRLAIAEGRTRGVAFCPRCKSEFSRASPIF